MATYSATTYSATMLLLILLLSACIQSRRLDENIVHPLPFRSSDAEILTVCERAVARMALRSGDLSVWTAAKRAEFCEGVRRSFDTPERAANDDV